MKFIKRLFIIIIILVFIAILGAGGTYLFMKIKYGVDPINTVIQLKTLSEPVDETKLAPNPYTEQDMVNAVTSINRSVSNLVSYNESEGYKFNYSEDKTFRTDFYITDKQLGALTNNLLISESKDEIKISDKKVDIRLVDLTFTPKIQNQKVITTISTIINLSLEPFLTVLNNFPLNLIKSKVPNNIYLTSTFDIVKTNDYFGYEISHNSILLNTLTSSDSENFINTLNVLLGIGTAETLNLSLANNICNILIGNQFNPGLVYKLSLIGATSFEFTSLNNLSVLHVK